MELPTVMKQPCSQDLIPWLYTLHMHVPEVLNAKTCLDSNIYSI